jgi:outer membrane protein
MKKMLIVAALGLLTMGTVAAQQSPWLVRARAVNLDMANKDATGLGMGVKSKTTSEFDVSYFLNNNVAAELVLSQPQTQSVTANGSDIGSFKSLSPTLMLQYHFTDVAGIKPYLGSGLSYVHITSADLSKGAAALGVNSVGLDDHSIGLAYQMGADVSLSKSWSINVDFKKIYMKTHVYTAGSDKGILKLDPVVMGVGLGYRF